MSRLDPDTGKVLARLEAMRSLSELRQLIRTGGFSYAVETACHRLDVLDHPAITEIKIRAFTEVARSALERGYLGLGLSWLERMVDLGANDREVFRTIVEVCLVQGDATRARWYLEQMRIEAPTDKRLRRYAGMAA